MGNICSGCCFFPEVGDSIQQQPPRNRRHLLVIPEQQRPTISIHENDRPTLVTHEGHRVLVTPQPPRNQRFPLVIPEQQRPTIAIHENHRPSLVTPERLVTPEQLLSILLTTDHHRPRLVTPKPEPSIIPAVNTATSDNEKFKILSKVINKPQKCLRSNIIQKLLANITDCSNLCDGNVYTLSRLNNESLEYRIIENVFRESTWKFLTVEKIDKVCNPYLLLQYNLKILEYKSKQKHVVENTMFHGTSKNNIDSICKHNFNWRLHVSGHVEGRGQSSRNGRGVNFTPTAFFAAHYSDNESYNIMFMAKVLVGNQCAGSYGTIVPPEGYDTTTDQKISKKVYVKYDDSTFYPAYIIHYSGTVPKNKKRRPSYD